AIDEAPPADPAIDAADVAQVALASMRDFIVEMLPPLRFPLAGSPELDHIELDPSSRPIAPITARPRDTTLQPSVHFSLLASPTRLATPEDGSAVDLHIDGLPGASSAAPWRVAPVQPTSVDPNAFSMGARWAIDDRIQAPVLDTIAWHAQADLT